MACGLCRKDAMGVVVMADNIYSNDETKKKDVKEKNRSKKSAQSLSTVLDDGDCPEIDDLFRDILEN